MYAMRGNVTRLLLMVCLTTFLVGCPLKGDNGLTLILSPDSLNFGVDEESLIFQIHRNLTNAPVEPVVVSTSQSWIIPETCTTEGESCLGVGIVDRMFIPIRIDRTKMLLGTNHGEVFVRTGGAAVQKLDIYAEDILFVDFRVSTRTPAVGQAVTFDDASEKTEDAGVIVSRLWDFGDNTSSTATDPSHVYTRPGLYSVSLTITTANGEETTRKAAWITVGSPAPTTDFEASATSIFSGDSVIFTDLSISPSEAVTGRLWDFGDGRTSTNARPEHQYTQAGVYTVSLTVNTANATKTETKRNYIVVQRKLAPEARFSVNPSSPIALASASFGDNSEAGSAPIQQWFWSFGDNTTSRRQDPIHVFDDGGDYSVSLTVVSAHGSDTATQLITVRTIPPIASFSVSDQTPFVLDEVTFTNASTAGSAEVDQYLWEFGDGASSNLENPKYTYNRAGNFIVRLTVITAHGTNSTTKQVSVTYQAPTANFSASPQSPNVGESVQFMDLSTQGTTAITSWLWNFGDPDSGAANTSSLKNPTHVYNAGGVYDVSLTVTISVDSNNSDTITKTNFIEAVIPPTPSFTSAVVNPNTPDLIQFTDTSVAGTEGIIGWLWNFGDPDSPVNSSTSPNPTHQFSKEGTFTVTLAVRTASRPNTPEVVSNMVMVDFLPPEADFTVETVGTIPRTDVLVNGALTTETLKFFNMITLGTDMNEGAFEHSWTFGDGNVSTLQEPTHKYTNGGTFTVTYTLKTPGDEVSASYDVDVAVPPVPQFSSLPMSETRANQSIQFFDQSTVPPGAAAITGWVWDFGDGGALGLIQNPSHSYAFADEYTVSLRLTFNHTITNAPMSITETKLDYMLVVP